MSWTIPDGWYRITTADNRFHVYADHITPAPRPVFAHHDRSTVWYAQRVRSQSGDIGYRIIQQGRTDVLEHKVDGTSHVWADIYHGGRHNQRWRINTAQFPGLENIYTLSPRSALDHGLTMPNPNPGVAPTPLQVTRLPAESLLPARVLFTFVPVAMKGQSRELPEGASDEEVEKYVADESLDFEEPSFEPRAGVDIDIFAEAAPEEAK